MVGAVALRHRVCRRGRADRPFGDHRPALGGRRRPGGDSGGADQRTKRRQRCRSAHELQRNARAMASLRWLRAQSPTPAQTADQLPPAVLRTGIELDGVGVPLSGTDRDVLTDVSLRIPPGNHGGDRRRERAGKSTLVKLLCQFYQPTAGQIRLRASTCGGSIRCSGGCGRRPASRTTSGSTCRPGRASESVTWTGSTCRGRCRRRVVRADAQPVIDRLPEGLDSHLGRRTSTGEELSGGQWQRVALSRAMMREEPCCCCSTSPPRRWIR